MPSSRRLAPALLITVLLLATDAAADPPEQANVALATQPSAEEDDDFVHEEPGADCDASADGEADVEELIADQPEDRTIDTPAPLEWRESAGRQCTRYHGRRTCDGPRRVPEPIGPAALLAAQLGLDESQVARVALREAPPEPWVSAVEGEIGAGLLWPVVGGRIWRGYGRHREILGARRGHLRRGRRRILHPGVDIGAAEGTPIRAANDGLVVYSFNGIRGYGNVLLLVHADGTLTLYGHCRATYVFAGQQVRRGQVIAEVGDTGLAHGAHLHFEWRRAGQPVDPLPHFVGRDDQGEDEEAGDAQDALEAP